MYCRNSLDFSSNKICLVFCFLNEKYFYYWKYIMPILHKTQLFVFGSEFMFYWFSGLFKAHRINNLCIYKKMCKCIKEKRKNRVLLNENESAWAKLVARTFLSGRKGQYFWVPVSFSTIFRYLNHLSL